MIFSHLLSAAAASPVEKAMHTVHEVVGWSVLSLAGAVMVLGATWTYLLCRKTESELTETIERTPLLKSILDLHRNYLGPAYRTLFTRGAVGLCASIYSSFEVGAIDRLNYAVAGAVRGLSDLLYKYAELAGIDKVNYLVADGAVGLSSRFRKTHTGILSYNMILVGFTLVLFLVLSLYTGGFLR